jgi:hypothetical protein
MTARLTTQQRSTQRGLARRERDYARLKKLHDVPRHRRDAKWQAREGVLLALLFGGRLGRRMARRAMSHRRRNDRTERLAKRPPTQAERNRARRARRRPIVEKAPGDVIARLTTRVARFYETGAKAATRALICAEHGVPNTGRQWRKLRKQIRREDQP